MTTKLDLIKSTSTLRRTRHYSKRAPFSDAEAEPFRLHETHRRTGVDIFGVHWPGFSSIYFGGKKGKRDTRGPGWSWDVWAGTGTFGRNAVFPRRLYTRRGEKTLWKV